MKGIHLRYLDEDVRLVEGVGVFQKGTVGFVPRDLAVQLIASRKFEAVSNGPTAQVFVVRIGQDTIPSVEVAPPTRAEPEGPADFELALEEEERRLAAAAATEEETGRA